MKNLRTTLSAIVMLALVGCVKVQYDNQYFRAITPRTHQVGEASAYLSIISDSPDAGTFNSKQQGPYFLIVKADTPDKNVTPYIKKVSIQSKEGHELEVHEKIELKPNNYTGEGMWWTKKIEQSFLPKFYEEQIISVEVELEIGGISQTIEQDFIPKHVKGPETINLLTM